MRERLGNFFRRFSNLVDAEKASLISENLNSVFNYVVNVDFFSLKYSQCTKLKLNKIYFLLLSLQPLLLILLKNDKFEYAFQNFPVGECS